MKAQNNLGTDPIGRLVIRLAVPSMLAQFVSVLYSIVDRMFIGNLPEIGDTALAGVGVAGPIVTLLSSFASLIGIGGAPLMSIRMGEKQEDKAREIVANSFIMLLVISAVLTVAALLLKRPLLMWFGASGSTFPYADAYMTIYVCGTVFALMSTGMNQFIISQGYAKTGMFSVLIGAAANIILDPLFMFVILPPGQEVLGAGIATALSNGIACLFFITVVLRMGKGSVVTFNPRAGLASKESVIAVFAVGVPSAVATFLFDLDYVIIDKLMVSYHDLALAAVGIVLKVERFPLNVGVGICQGMLPLVAYSYGAGNHRRMNDTIRLARRVGLLIAAVSIVLYEIFAGPLVRIFLSDAQAVEMASGFLRIRVLATPLMFLSFFTVYLFQAFGRGRISLFLGVMRWLVFNIPMLFILNHFFGMYGIVWSQVVADSLTVLLSFYVLRRFGPKKEAVS